MMHEDQHDVAPHDQAIEDVLHALRTTEPPQDYEARIHSALLQAQQAKASNHFNVSLNSRHPERSAAKPKDLLASLLPWMSWAAACVVVLILGNAVRSYMHHNAPRNVPVIAKANTPSSQPAVVVAAEARTRTIRPQISRATRIQKSDESIQPRRIEVALQTHEYIPEPPMPLTEEERLVIRMARSNDAQQLAEYTPDARARHLREDAKDYREYFAARPLEGQPLYVQTIYHQQLSGETQ